MIHRAWDGAQPQWVAWTGKAVSTTCSGQLHTGQLDPELPGSTPARRSNIYRLRKIYDQGGLWLDCDVVPLVDLYTLYDEPWMGHAAGKLRGGVMFYPEGHHPDVAAILERALADPDTVLADHIAAVAPDVRPEPRVLPHGNNGTWLLGNNETPLAVHLWLSSGRLIP